MGPSYKGHSLAYWIMRYDPAITTEEAKQARMAIFEIGTNAVPYLMEWIKYKETPNGYGVLDWVDQPIGWFQEVLGIEHAWSVHDNSRDRADGAARAFSALSPEITIKMVPELSRLADQAADGDSYLVAGRAIGALSALGEFGTASILAAVTGTNKFASDWAIREIDRILGNPDNLQRVIPVLITAIKNREWRIAFSAANHLASRQLEPEIVVPVLIRWVSKTDPVHFNFNSRDKDALHQVEAAGALRKYGAKARPAVTTLQAALNDPDEGVRKEAASALYKIAPEILTNMPSLLRNH